VNEKPELRTFFQPKGDWVKREYLAKSLNVTKQVLLVTLVMFRTLTMLSPINTRDGKSLPFVLAATWLIPARFLVLSSADHFRSQLENTFRQPTNFYRQTLRACRQRIFPAFQARDPFRQHFSVWKVERKRWRQGFPLCAISSILFRNGYFVCEELPRCWRNEMDSADLAESADDRLLPAGEQTSGRSGSPTPLPTQSHSVAGWGILCSLFVVWLLRFCSLYSLVFLP
jgi:hypothetical protein